MATVNTLLRDCARRLESVSDSPLLDAKLLLCHAFNCSQTELITRLHDECTPPDVLELYIQRRAAYEPIAYILEKWEFYSLEFAVRPPMLVPRPETEHLVEAVLVHMDDLHADIFEIGTGTGCIAISLAVQAPNASIYASDIRLEAVKLASENANHHKVQITFFAGDLFEAIKMDTTSGLFDVIVSNPPYVENSAWGNLSPTIRNYEDVNALLSGDDGLDCIRRIIRVAPDYLRPGGLLALELGETHWPTVKTLCDQAGLEHCAAHNDLSGLPRILTALKPR